MSSAFAEAGRSAQRQGLIRPAYSSLRDYQRSRLYAAESGALCPSRATREQAALVVQGACAAFQVTPPQVRFDSSDPNSTSRPKAIRDPSGSYSSITDTIWLNPDQLADVVILHECAHCVINRYFPSLRDAFEPAHGPWFASVAFRLYNDWGALDRDALSSAGLRFAIPIDHAQFLNILQEQSSIWSRICWVLEVEKISAALPWAATP